MLQVPKYSLLPGHGSLILKDAHTYVPTTYLPPTYHLPTYHLPTTYLPPTYLLPTSYLPPTYLPHTTYLPTYDASLTSKLCVQLQTGQGEGEGFIRISLDHRTSG